MTSKKLQVHWWERARWKVRQGEVVINQLSAELLHVFKGQGFREVTVYDVFLGYNQDERRRIVLAVSATAAGTKEEESDRVAPPQSNLVKIGRRSDVERDYTRWSQALAEKGLVSRFLSSVRGVALPKHEQDERFAVVYQDAYRLYGADNQDNAARPLEEAVKCAIQTNVPECKSLERMLIELYSDMFRCCYRSANDQDARPVVEFYQGELTKKSKLWAEKSAWDRWLNDPSLQLLRRDALWLTTALRNPKSTEMPLYLDPVDYFRAMLIDTDTPQVPATLFGPGHGDLHGRNVVVGILRNEVFQPSVFDYGDMSLNNLPVWDFVKLEMELKCRLLSHLCDSSDARSALRHYLSLHVNDMPEVSRHFKVPETPSLKPKTSTEESLDGSDQPTPAVTAACQPAPTMAQADAAKHTSQLEIAVLFEQALAHLTRGIDGKAHAEKRIAEEDRSPTRHPVVDRALCLFYSLRKEAACWLGYELDRHHRWKDEYYFALAAYGLLTAKWQVDGPHQAWALIAAGVAVTQLSTVADQQTGLPARLRQSLEITLPATWACPSGSSAFALPLPVVQKRGNHPGERGGGRLFPSDCVEHPELAPTNTREFTHLIPLAHGTHLSELEPPQYEQSAAVLKRALEEFPNAVSLRTELALALANSNQPQEALSVVQDMRSLCSQFRDHELLCRVGRAYKEMGDALWAADNPRLSLTDVVKSKHSGCQRYGQALACYREAFEFSGHYYPAINAATMALLHGESKLAEYYAHITREICGPLRPDEDEQLWVFATEGEACLILGELDEAKSFYQSAFKLPQCRVPKTIKSIFSQLARLHWALGAVIIEPIIQAMRDQGLQFDETKSAFYLQS